VKAYYNRLAEQQADTVNHVLQSIDERLNQLVTLTGEPLPSGSALEIINAKNNH
jgi:hypothetical protein